MNSARAGRTAPVIALCTLLGIWVSACGGGGGGGGSSAVPGGGGGGAGGGGPLNTQADLRLLTLSFSPQSLSAGQTVQVTDTVENRGSEASGVFEVGIYLSSDSAIEASDMRLGVRSLLDLAPGARSSGSGLLTIPASTPAGTYFVGAIADDAGRLGESDELDNVLRAEATLAVAPAVLPDLVPSTVVFSPAVRESGRTIEVEDRLANLGSASAPAFQISVLLSSDAVIDPGDRLLGLRSVAGLAPGAEDAGSGSLTLPSSLPAGIYYVGVLVDGLGQVVEIHEDNNVMAALHPLTVITPPRPDLVMTGLDFTPSHVESASLFDVSDSVLNQGVVDSPAFQVGLYLSEDELIDATDTFLGQRTLASLAVGTESQGSGSVLVPPELPGGDYFVGAIADRQDGVGETDEGNNSFVALGRLRVTVPPRPDLVATALSFSPAQLDPALGTISVSDRVVNQGQLAAGVFDVGVFLSTNNVISSGDVFLGSRSVAGLAVGEESSGSGELNLPAGLSPGSYFIGLVVDPANVLLELNEANNALVAAGVLDVIQTPDPMADLVVSDVSFSPARVVPGEPMQVLNTVRNEGDLSSGVFRVGIFLSSDDVITPDDRLLGERTVFNLAIDFGSASSSPINLPAGTAAGDYFLGVIADYQGSVAERDEDNNSLRASGTLEVFIPPPPSPDLSFSALSFSPPSVAPAEALTVDDSLRNTGELPAGACRVAYYLSLDDVLEPGTDTLLGLRDLPALAAGAEVSSQQVFFLPAALAVGNYRVGAIVDDQDLIEEGDEEDNQRLAEASLAVQ